MVETSTGSNLTSRRKERMRRRFKHLFSNRAEQINRTKTGNFFIFTALFAFGIFSVMPLVMVVSNAFKTIGELMIFPPTIIVRNPWLGNFTMLFSLLSNTWVPLSRYAFNTIFNTVVGTFGHVIIASLAAFPLAKHKFPGGKVLFRMVVLSLMFHSAVNDVVNYLTMSWLHWIDTYFAVLVPTFGGSFGLFLMRQFMTQFPDSILESAKIDGATEYKTFWSIVMPNMKPAWLTLSIFCFQGLWNNSGSSYIYAEQLKPLTYAISQIVAGGLIRAGAAAAVHLIMLTVPITFFIITQSNILQTMSSSGMKE